MNAPNVTTQREVPVLASLVSEQIATDLPREDLLWWRRWSSACLHRCFIVKIPWDRRDIKGIRYTTKCLIKNTWKIVSLN